jgi:Na+/H+ antiporter NhaD/arsenite permease-like protein
MSFASLAALIQREKLAAALLALLLVLCLIAPDRIMHIPGLIDARTLAALGGLLCLTTALDLSGGLRWSAARLIDHAGTQRLAALALVALTVIAAMFVTNDVALFIAVPLTLNLSRLTGQSPVRLVIFEALAANTGSLLTPIGNPQNLFLWQTSDVSFMAFTAAMAPLAAVLIAALLLTTWLAFPARRLQRHEVEAGRVDRGLLAAALVLYPLFLIAVNAGWAVPAGLALLGLFLIFRRGVLARLDWALLLVFALMFVDLRLLAGLPAVSHVLTGLSEPHRLYGAAIVLSQVISNVPAAIALEPFTHDWKSLSYGVNIGGFGLLPGSLANLIALRLLGHKGAWRSFHLWSIPALILAAAVGYGLLFRH